MRTFDVKFKRKVDREYLSGKGGYKILATKYDIADSLVRRWVGGISASWQCRPCSSARSIHV
jgi:transposase-like protein